MITGMVLATRRALRARAAAAAGPAAALSVWFLHASIDWDWQLPAVTLPAIVLAGALIAIAEDPSATPGVDGIEPALRGERAPGRVR